nr:response regulator transcription factor [Paenibacillus mangrovi]
MKRVIPWDDLEAEWIGDANDGKLGLKLVRIAHPDIVITDIYMPEMSGLEMVEQLRTEGYEGKIIILSGYSDFEYARKALRLHVNDYLSKPVTVQTIKEVLQGVIAQLEEEQTEWIKSVVTGTWSSLPAGFRQRTPVRKTWDRLHHLAIGIEMHRTAGFAAYTNSEWHLMRFAVGNVIREVVDGEWPKSEYIELHSNHSVILLHSAPELPDEMVHEQALRLGERLIACVRTHLKLQIYVGLGALKRDWRDISVSTEEAFLAISFKDTTVFLDRFLYDYNAIRHSENGARLRSSRRLIRPVQFYHQFADYIRNSLEKEACGLVRGYLSNPDHAAYVTASELVLTGTELWVILSYTLYDFGVHLEQLFPEVEVREQLNAITVPDQLAEWLTDKISAIFASRSGNENVRHKRVVEYMIDYIHQHYSENVTVSDLANQVYISRNYLSQIFKNATGETFNSYVTRVRMENAKSLILEGKYLIYEIADKVGYKNIPYFSTLFKKYTGLNPSELAK